MNSAWIKWLSDPIQLLKAVISELLLITSIFFKKNGTLITSSSASLTSGSSCPLQLATVRNTVEEEKMTNDVKSENVFGIHQTEDTKTKS